MADDYAAQYLARRGADPEEQRRIAEMEQASRRDVIHTYRQDSWPGYGGDPEEQAHAETFNWVQQGGPEKVAGFAKDTAENAFQGTVKAMRETDKTLRDMPAVGPAYSRYADLVTDIASNAMPGLDLASREYMAKLQADDTENDKMAQMFFQYTVPFMGWMKTLNVAAGGSQAMAVSQKAASAVGADVLTSWTALEPHFERFSQFLNEFETARNVPVLNRTIEYLASTDDSDAEERLKNIGDSLLAGGLISTVAGGTVGALKLMRRAYKLSRVEEAAEAAVKKPKKAKK